MLERGGRLHEDSRVYKRRDRTEVWLGKEDFEPPGGDNDGGRTGG